MVKQKIAVKMKLQRVADDLVEDDQVDEEVNHQSLMLKAVLM